MLPDPVSSTDPVRFPRFKKMVAKSEVCVLFVFFFAADNFTALLKMIVGRRRLGKYGKFSRFELLNFQGVRVPGLYI